MFVLSGLIAWGKALIVVIGPFLKLAAIWSAWQLGIGCMAWGTARFYSINCAPPGLTGYFASLFAMGNPICVSAWFSHAAFVVAYIASFVAALLIAMIWVWKQSSAYPMIRKLRKELEELKAYNGATTTRSQRPNLMRHGEEKKRV